MELTKVKSLENCQSFGSKAYTIKMNAVPISVDFQTSEILLFLLYVPKNRPQIIHVNMYNGNDISNARLGK